MQDASNMAAARKRLGPTHKLARSKVANGTDMLPGVDRRSTWARLMRDVVEELTAHCGGEDVMSAPKRMMVRRAAALEAELVHTEVEMAAARAAGRQPEPLTWNLYCALTNAQRRAFEGLGLERAARDVTVPSLAKYLEMKVAVKGEDDADG